MSTNTALAIPVETWSPPAQPRRTRHMHLVPPPQADTGPDERWVRRLTQSIVEVLAGERSPTPLVKSLSPAVYHALREPNSSQHLRGGKVLRVRVEALSDRSVEVAAVVACPRRTRAMILRLHHRHDRWRCVTVAVI